MRRVGAVVAAALTLAPTALADPASSAQVADLARRTRGDATALARLRRIDRVDGRPVDLARALAGARGADLMERLRTLASAAGTSTVQRSPRGQAHDILSGRRYRGSSLPRPFHGVLHWLGQKLAFVGRAVHWLERQLPGGGWVVWPIIGAIVVLLAALAAIRLSRRRSALAVHGRVGTRADAVDPRELERLAEEAEGRGELELALRLRFQAGLLRLQRVRAIPPRPSLTSGEARRLLRLEEFDRLARDFDEVVYGGRPPRPEDVAASRRDWPRVVEKAAAAA